MVYWKSIKRCTLSLMACIAVAGCGSEPPPPPTDITVCKGFKTDAFEAQLNCPVGAGGAARVCSYLLETTDANILQIQPNFMNVPEQRERIGMLVNTIGVNPGVVTVFGTHNISNTPFTGQKVRLGTVRVTNQACLTF